MKTRTSKRVEISGERIVITVEAFATGRFGYVFKARNDYGEPCVSDKGYRTAQEAFSAELNELRAMLS